MTTRSEMLALLAARLKQPAPRLQVPPWDAAPSVPAQAPRLAPGELARRFLAEHGKLGGQGLVAPGAAAAVAYVLQAVAEAPGDGPVLLWDDPLLARLGLVAALADRGIAAAVWQPELGNAALKALAAGARAGITAAGWALAETGSIALPAAPGRGRLVSLLPRTHIAVIPQQVLVPSVAELLRRLAEQDPALLPSSLALATGPSRSADIENDLSIGVHGPAVVHAVVLAG